ncbi:MAG: nucleoside triphosphate pyrophosphohydrolase [Fimbriimonadales bacterium]|nr:nucleoside triphosphate pyrophosphohydrolase [Fimbriimonadales bacterium]
MITIVGLGPGDPELIPRRNIESLRSGKRVILRTKVHPSVSHLEELGLSFETCDDLYETVESFDELYEAIADRVLSAAECVYAVPGHPLFGEESVRILQSRGQTEILGAPSFVDVVLDAVGKPISGALQVWNAYDPRSHFVDPRSSQIIFNLDSKEVASESKLWLMRFYPPEHSVSLIQGWRSGINERKVDTPLAELDHFDFDPLTSAFIEGLPLERPHGFYGLVDIVDTLLGPDGCPWDREQTHETLKKHLIEEAYETIEAIDSNDPDKLCEELGDLLLQPLMHSQMDAIEGLYDIDDVIEAISSKLVRRHPHVFGDVEVESSQEVLSNWDSIKQAESASEKRSILAGVPSSLPALLRAYEVSKRAARVGFEWPDADSVMEKVGEELTELREALLSGDHAAIEAEFGDLLFALVNVARWKGVEPEEALRKMVLRFATRFESMESNAKKPLKELSAREWDELWESAKQDATD